MHKYLAQFAFGNSDPEILAKVLIYPRVLGTSITTTFGNQKQAYCGSVLSGHGSLVNGMDIEFIDCIDGKKKKTDKDFPVYIGRDFWHRLTGDEDFYDILTQNNPIGNLIMR